MILFKVTNIQKRSTLLPTHNEIFKLYNKYKKGYDYTKEAWDMKDKVLYTAKIFLKNSEQFIRMSNDVGKEYNYGVEWDSWVESWFKQHGKDPKYYITANEITIEELQEAIPKLENAKKEFNILVAIDHIFNIVHDQGPILIGLMHNTGGYAADEIEIKEFLETLNTIRDW